MDGAIGKDRRELLKACTGLVTGVALLGSPFASLATARAWEVRLGAFTSPQASTWTDSPPDLDSET